MKKLFLFSFLLLASSLCAQVKIKQGGTESRTAAGALKNLVPDTTGKSTKVLSVAAGGGFSWVSASGGGTNASSQATPADPTGTTDGTGKMMGLAGSFTPSNTGKVLIIISGTSSNTSGNGASVRLRYGTGSAPANGDALTGTLAGGTATAATYFTSSGAWKTPFTVSAVVTGLTLSTAYWIDVQVAVITAGTASISGVSVSVIEF